MAIGYSSSYADIFEHIVVLKHIHVAIGIAVVLASCSVLITGVVFYDVLTRNKIFMKMLMMISLCDLFSGSAAAMGYPGDEQQCVIQGFLTFFFVRGTWLWTCCISYCLYVQITSGHIRTTFFAMNVYIWTFNIILQILPYFGGMVYGGQLCVDGVGFGNLQIKGAGHSQFDKENVGRYISYTALTFYGPLILCVSTMLISSAWLFLVTLPTIRTIDTELAEKVIFIIKSAALYPLFLIIAWMPSFITWSVTQAKLRDKGVAGVSYELALATNVSFGWGNFYGVFLATIFWLRSPDSRRYWKAAIKGVFSSKSGLSATDRATKDMARRSREEKKFQIDEPPDWDDDNQLERDSEDFSLDDTRMAAAMNIVRTSLRLQNRVPSAKRSSETPPIKGNPTIPSSSSSSSSSSSEKKQKRLSKFALNSMNIALNSVDECPEGTFSSSSENDDGRNSELNFNSGIMNTRELVAITTLNPIASPVKIKNTENGKNTDFVL